MRFRLLELLEVVTISRQVGVVTVEQTVPLSNRQPPQPALRLTLPWKSPSAV